MKTLMPLSIVLAGFLWAPAVPASEPPCGYIPEFRELVASCAADPKADVCAWVAAVRKMASEESDPTSPFRALFGLPRDEAIAVEALLVQLTHAVSLEECREDRLRYLGKRLTAELWNNPNLPLIVYLLAFEDPRLQAVLAAAREELDPGAEPARIRLAGAYLELLRRVGRADLRQRMFRLDPGVFDARDWAVRRRHENPSEEQAHRQLDAILRDFDAGRIEEARLELKALCQSYEPIFAVRAGYVVARHGWLEDGELVLRQAAERLAAKPDFDPADRFLPVVVAWARTRVLAEMGLQAEARKIQMYLDDLGDPVARALLTALSETSPDEPETLPKAGMNIAALIEASELAEKVGQLEAFTRAFRSIFPLQKWSTERPANEGPLFLADAILTHIEKGDAAGAEQAAERYLDLFPRYGNLDILVPVARAYREKGDAANAVRIARRLIDLLEGQIFASRLDDSTRATLDSSTYTHYAFGIDLAAWLGLPGDSLELAERGRAAVLRRRLGAAQPPGEGGRSSFLEKEIAREITAMERDPVRGDREMLSTHYRSFERARFDRQVKDIGSTSQPAPPRELRDLSALQRTLGENEAVLAYHEIFYAGTPGLSLTEQRRWPELQRRRTLWIWLVTRDGLRQTQSPLQPEDWPRIECLTQILRWQGSSDAPRRAAGSRGVEILESCPDSRPGADPAALLYDLLVRPAAGWLVPGRRLIVLPHGTLHAVPFAALRNRATGRRLLEDFDLSVAPSLGVLSQVRERRTGPSLSPRPAPPPAGSALGPDQKIARSWRMRATGRPSLVHSSPSSMP